MECLKKQVNTVELHYLGSTMKHTNKISILGLKVVFKIKRLLWLATLNKARVKCNISNMWSIQKPS